MSPFLLLSFLLTVGAEASGLSVVEPASAWPKRTIRVCWSEEASPRHFGENPRRAVQEIIQQEYTLARTGIEFVGWESCATLPEGVADVKIRQSTKNMGGFFRIWGMASIGKGREDSKPHLYLFYDENLAPEYKMDPLEHLQMIALHEFGHLAGLRHEHIRDEALGMEDAKCLTGEKADSSVSTVGDYDRNSIMNYCWNHHIRKHGTLLTLTSSMIEALSLISPPEREEQARSFLKRFTRYRDQSLFGILFSESPNTIGLKVKIGLSHGDLIALRTLYP